MTDDATISASKPHAEVFSGGFNFAAAEVRSMALSLGPFGTRVDVLFIPRGFQRSSSKLLVTDFPVSRARTWPKTAKPPSE